MFVTHSVAIPMSILNAIEWEYVLLYHKANLLFAYVKNVKPVAQAPTP